MKTFSKVQTSLKKLTLKATSLKQKVLSCFRPEKLKQLQVVKYYRNSKALSLRLDHRLQQHNNIPEVFDETERKCSNCGHHFIGRICPQCGQAGTWSRYTWKQAFFNLLDIWGLGNRPVFRTLRELFYRPGYMIRDYLNGHRQFYFPPFKLVAVAVVLLVFVGWLTGIHGLSPFSSFTEAVGLDKVNDWEGIKVFVGQRLDKIELRLEGYDFVISSALRSVIAAVVWFIWFLSKNMLYEWLFIGAFLGVCIWIAFIRVNRHNFVETYIFLTYVMGQFLLCLIPGTILVWLKGSLATVSPFFDVCIGYVFCAYSIAICFLLLLDFRQFFGLTWKSTISHLLLTFLVGITLLIVIGALITNIALKDFDAVASIVIDLTALVLIVKGFCHAKKILRANETVNRVVIICCKAAMLVILYIFRLDSIISVKPVFLYFILVLLAMVVYTRLSVYLSLLPVTVYKKYHRTSFALLSLLPVAILFFVMVIL